MWTCRWSFARKGQEGGRRELMSAGHGKPGRDREREGGELKAAEERSWKSSAAAAAALLLLHLHRLRLIPLQATGHNLPPPFRPRHPHASRALVLCSCVCERADGHAKAPVAQHRARSKIRQQGVVASSWRHQADARQSI